jgi:hypothetical protein
MRGRGASAALRAGPLGGQRRSSRLLSPADTRPLGAASVWRRVLSCDVATLRRVMASSLTGASAAHWAASTRLGTVAGAVLAMQRRCYCLRLPAIGTPRVLWGRGGVHQPTRRLRLLEWKRGLSAACHPKMRKNVTRTETNKTRSETNNPIRDQQSESNSYSDSRAIATYCMHRLGQNDLKAVEKGDGRLLPG